jgi:superfamily II DNA or RNA helicase
VIRIAHNAVMAQLVDADEAAKLEVHRLLSYRVEGAEHSMAFQSGGWNGRSSFFAFDAGTFPTGFVRLVAAGLRKFGREVQIVSKPRPEPLGPERPVVDDFGYEERYDYQPAAVDQVVRHGNVTAQVATGGGKSRIARMAYLRIARPTLFITTRSILLYQMKDSVEEMTGKPVAVLGDGEWGIPYTKPDGSEGRKLTHFAVGMVQTLAQRLAKPDPTADAKEQQAQARRRAQTLEVLSKFEFVIAEEAHEVSGDSFYDVVQACRNAHYRLALTATPFMKTDEAANMKLLAAIGPIGIRISEQLLIERGILARPYFKFLKMPVMHKPKRLYRTTGWQSAYKFGIVENEYRNKALCAEVMRGARYGLNAMMLVQHKMHGAILEDMLVKVGMRAKFIWGDSSKKERAVALKALGTGELQVLIGSTILDVGVDVPSVGMILLAGGGKAEVGTRQRIGRGLREKRNGGPNVAFIVDVEDDHNTHLREHARMRRSIIESTPGFVEGIVDDFNFALLGLERKAA